MASTLDKPDTTPTPEPNELTVTVDARDYEAALDDPKVRQLHERADDLLRSLEAKGRNL